MNSKVSVTVLNYFYRAVCASLRYTQYRSHIAVQDAKAKAKKNGEQVEQELAVFCLWHDEFFPLMHLKQDLDIICIVSSSKDGTILDNLLQSLGLHTASGSSRRNGLKALLTCAKTMKNDGIHCCITIDGPMGPRHVAKDGAFLLAQKANARIVPVRLVMHTALRLPSWDKFQIPLPFSRVEAYFGEGFFVNNELTEEALEQYRAQLEAELAGLAPYNDKE